MFATLVTAGKALLTEFARKTHQRPWVFGQESIQNVNWSDVHVSPPLNIVNNMVVEVGLLKTFTAINVLSIATPGTGAYVDPLKKSVKLMVHGQEKT